MQAFVQVMLDALHSPLLSRHGLRLDHQSCELIGSQAVTCTSVLCSGLCFGHCTPPPLRKLRMSIQHVQKELWTPFDVGAKCTAGHGRIMVTVWCQG